MRKRISIECCECGAELLGSDRVYEYAGCTYCEECFAEKFGCDPCDAQETAFNCPDVSVETAEEYAQDSFYCFEDFEFALQREERLAAEELNYGG